MTRFCEYKSCTRQSPSEHVSCELVSVSVRALLFITVCVSVWHVVNMFILCLRTALWFASFIYYYYVSQITTSDGNAEFVSMTFGESRQPKVISVNSMWDWRGNSKQQSEKQINTLRSSMSIVQMI